MKDKKIIIYIITGIAIGIILKDIIQIARYKKIDKIETIGTIEITNDFINVREHPNTKSKKIYEATKNEKYKYIEVYEEETGDFKWYKIKFSDRRIGWVATPKVDKWVKER